MAVLFDTGRLDAAERSAALYDVLAGATAPHELNLLGRPEDVHATLEFWALGPDVSVLKQVSSGIVHTRDQRHDRHDGPERVVFVLHDGAVGTYLSDGAVHRLSPGALYVTDLNSHYSYARPGDGVARIVQVERSLLGLTAEQVQAAAGRVIASPLYNLFRNNVAVLCRDADGIQSSSQAITVGDAIGNLASAMLHCADEADTTATASDWIVERVVIYLHDNYWRSELGADEIAAAHGISTRYLFKLWSGRSRTLMETLMAVRLEAARQMLILDLTVPVATVAHRCGFVSASHFTTRFKVTFGSSPMAFRRESTVSAGR
jgi:AraC-like DNA-binding protein